MSAPSEGAAVPHTRQAGAGALLLAWGVVLAPAAWGVAQTIAKAAALFR